MLAYTSFISDVHESYRVEKILIFLFIKISKCQSVPNAILSQLQNILRLLYGKTMWNKIAFGTN